MGSGLVLASLLWIAQGHSQPSKAQIEAWAKGLGMVYRDEVVAYAPAPAQPPGSQERSSEVASPKATIPNMVLIEIKGGTTSEQVADLLNQNGVIKDAMLLSRKLQEKDLATRIRAGYYLFRINTPLDTVIERITRLGF